MALAIGNGASVLLYHSRMTHDESLIGLVIAAVIFFALGVRLLFKAVRNERINERREETLHMASFWKMAAGTSIYTLLAGIAFGFLRTDLLLMLVTGACLTVAVVITGMYVGYHFGFVHKTKAYIAGAFLLWIAGADVVVRHILHYV